MPPRLPLPYGNGNPFNWDERTRNAADVAAMDRRKVFGWHSLSCICDDCLNSDAMVPIWGTKVDRINVEGLTREAIS